MNFIWSKALISAPGSLTADEMELWENLTDSDGLTQNDVAQTSDGMREAAQSLRDVIQHDGGLAFIRGTERFSNRNTDASFTPLKNSLSADFFNRFDMKAWLVALADECLEKIQSCLILSYEIWEIESDPDARTALNTLESFMKDHHVEYKSLEVFHSAQLERLQKLLDEYCPKHWLELKSAIADYCRSDPQPPVE